MFCAPFTLIPACCRYGSGSGLLSACSKLYQKLPTGKLNRQLCAWA